mgnify:CR=1 FL=1
MNKTELINAIAEKTGFTKKDSERALDAFVEAVTEALKKDEKVQLVGFGTLEVRTRAARKAVNPRTKEDINIPASKTVAFKVGKGLKTLVNA